MRTTRILTYIIKAIIKYMLAARSCAKEAWSNEDSRGHQSTVQRQASEVGECWHALLQDRAVPLCSRPWKEMTVQKAAILLHYNWSLYILPCSLLLSSFSETCYTCKVVACSPWHPLLPSSAALYLLFMATLTALPLHTI